MATKTYLKWSGTWRETKKLFLKWSGTWREIKKAYLKWGGTWRQVFSGAFEFTIVISSTTSNYNLASSLTALGWNGTDPVVGTVTVNSGVVVKSTTAPTPAFDTGAAFPADSIVTLVNNGTFYGKGGPGGDSGNIAYTFLENGAYNQAGYSRRRLTAPSPPYAQMLTDYGFVFNNSANGIAGAVALKVRSAITVTNNGTLYGGAGGGGAGASGGGMTQPNGFQAPFSPKTPFTPYYANHYVYTTGAGGGGGAGPELNSGGLGGLYTSANPSYTPYPSSPAGNSGTQPAGGGGGTALLAAYQALAAPPAGEPARPPVTPAGGGNGGAGGGPGQAGTQGNNAKMNAEGSQGLYGNGGLRGNYIDGNPFVTWPATGTRVGGVV